VTESEWQSSEDARDMLRCLIDQHNCQRRKAGRRRLRLFGCACCRLRWEALSDPRLRAAVEYVERWADGQEDVAALEGVLEEARLASVAVGNRWVLSGERPQGSAQAAEAEEQLRAAEAVLVLVHQRPSQSAYADPALRMVVGEGTAGSRQEKARRAWRGRLGRLAHLLRDIFGNPFRPVPFESSWGSGAAAALARTAYESRDFSAMPILGDALEENGCNNPDLLAHCRGSTVFHVRGCWLLDLLLGR
jgi:hypothetical protein